MNPFVATVILTVVLFAMSAWGYFGSDTPSTTALIPAGFGLMFGLCSFGVKKENKIVAHITVVLVVLTTLALLVPLFGSIGRGDMAAVARVSIMLLALVGTFVVYVRSFIDARKNASE